MQVRSNELLLNLHPIPYRNFKVIQLLYSRGRGGGGQVVSVLAFQPTI